MTVARTRQQLVEEGFEAVLQRKYSPASAKPRIFDGASEAKLSNRRGLARASGAPGLSDSTTRGLAPGYQR